MVPSSAVRLIVGFII